MQHGSFLRSEGNVYPINFLLKKGKKGHIHKSEQSFIEQEHWEVQPATSLGWDIAFHSRVENK